MNDLSNMWKDTVEIQLARRLFKIISAQFPFETLDRGIDETVAYQCIKDYPLTVIENLIDIIECYVARYGVIE